MEALKTYLKEVKTIPLLTAEQEVSLSKRIKKGDEHARKAMIQANLRLVISIAKKYMYLGIPLLDLIEEGNLGLMKAADKFNHKKGFRFSTYAAWWIRQGITRSISEQGKMIRVPVYMNELISKWRRTKETMSQKLKSLPTDEQVAKKLKLTPEKVEQINFWLSSNTSSLDAPIGEEEESQVIDLVEDRTSVSPDTEIKQIMDQERVNNLMAEVASERERRVLILRFGLRGEKRHTLAEVADKLDVSRERVRQIEDAVMKRLKRTANQQENE